MDKKTRFIIPVVIAIFTLAGGLNSIAAQDQENEKAYPPYREGYLTPPEAIAEEVLAPRHKNIFLDDNDLSPSAEYFINTVEASEMSPLSYYAKPYYNLAGLQVDWQANRHRSMTTHATVGLQLVDARNGNLRDLSTPGNARITDATWSPDGSKVAFFAHYDDATHIYVAETATGKSRRITRSPVLATAVRSIAWSGDGQHIYTVLIPEKRGDKPMASTVPNTLQVRKTTPEENRLRTYPSLLKNRNEADLLEYYITGQLVRINTRNRQAQKIGSPAMFESIDPAPGGEYIRVRITQKPFSYIVPVSRFGWTDQVWDTEGNMVVELRSSEVNTSIPEHEEVEDYGRKDIKWRPDGEGLSLVLVPEEEKKKEEEPNGNGDGNGDDSVEEEESEKDKKKIYKIVQWLPPFEKENMNTLYETDKEIESVSYNEEAEIYFVNEEKEGSEKVYAVFEGETDTTYTIYKRKKDEFYGNPGRLVYQTSPSGVRVVRTTDDSAVYLEGTQYYKEYTEKAPRPFLDRVGIRSGEKERIFQSSEEVYEEIAAILDEEASSLVLERQSATMFPDFWHHETSSGDRAKLTSNEDYNEAVSQARRDRFKVERADGFTFWAEVLVPADWNGTPLPGIIWHYPREYDGQEDYDKNMRDYNKNDYPGVYRRSTDILVKRGYAVIDADWPISAERGSPNEAFVYSIVQNSTAVLDSAEARGYIDRDRMAIGGHSYGAFGTANAMIHTSFFKAGIAGDGNYNRTLTPMGFQREPNDLWRGLDKYLEMSPIFWADRLDGALLMYHGEADQNVGTWPVHSKRMFHALNGIGKTAAMYMYPHEAHGPGAEETLLDLWTRWSDWLDHYVKNRGEHVKEEELGEGN